VRVVVNRLQPVTFQIFRLAICHVFKTLFVVGVGEFEEVVGNGEEFGVLQFKQVLRCEEDY